MHATHWLIGLTLLMAGIGTARAGAGHDVQDADANRNVGDSMTITQRESATGGGDVLGVTRASSPRPAPGESSSSAGASDHGDGADIEPRPAHQSHLGWQSLLPGSIQ